MKKRYIVSTILFIGLVTAVGAIVPPPPVNQNIGIYDTTITDRISPSVLTADIASTLAITGSNFVNDAYSSVVSVDGVTYTPTSITDTQILVNIPALTAGVHEIQLVKGDVVSKLSTLTVVPPVTITSAKLNTRNAQLTINGKGFGN